MKAVHYHRGARAVLGHSVRGLIASLDPPAEALAELLDAGRELDLFYVPTRHPSGLDDGTPGQAFAPTQAERAIELSGSMIDVAGEIIER